jgi:hypothetical protein
MLKWLAQTFYDFHADARRTKRAQLVTISYSHYNELARWALEADGSVPFEEHGYAPLQHALAALSIRMPSSGARHLAASSSFAGAKPSPTALPALVLPSGAVLKDSWEVAAATRLAPIAPALLEVLDRELGVAARKMVYCLLLKPEHAARFTLMCTEGRHWAWRLLWHCGLGAVLRGELEKKFCPGDAPGLAACVAQLDALVAPEGALAGALAAARRAGHPFLGGAALGQADIALCSIAALLVLPDEYGGAQRTMAPHFSYLLSHDAQVRALVQRWRQTEVGAYVLDVYRRHRVPG